MLAPVNPSPLRYPSLSFEGSKISGECCALHTEFAG
jgi:hypothetical protein